MLHLHTSETDKMGGKNLKNVIAFFYSQLDKDTQ